jgi:parallel beta-helix repeat protein
MLRAAPHEVVIGMVKRILALVLLALASGFVYGAPQASAEPASVECGATIIRNTTLHHDLINCPNNGILIGADNVTLDLNGHRVDGDGTLVGSCLPGTFCDGGIVNDGHSGLIVKGGSITDFGVGIFISRGDKNSIRRLFLDDNYFDGLVVIDSVQLEAEGNSMSRNGLVPHFAGAAMFGVTDASITNNRLSGNGDQGLFAVNSSNRNRIVHNTFSGDTESGLSVDGNGNYVSGNRIVGGGIILNGDDNILKANYVADPPVCNDGCGIGISIEGGTRAIIEQNVVVRAPIRGIRIDAYGSPAINDTIRKNVVRNAGVDGIAINLDNVGSVTGTLVELNAVTGSGDDGIDVESPSSTLRGNVAARNGDLGIEAITGVIDAGHNRAFANGNPLQCTNVQCSGGH